ncbi:MAG: hypothetical protein LBQ54_06505 [Planctomycetaceae bacterium]|jgi:hypothetical protein|nr:hypothetical protein [Planctomycetaceae bacterium]
MERSDHEATAMEQHVPPLPLGSVPLFVAHRKRLERRSIGSEPNEVSVSLPGSNALALAAGGISCYSFPVVPLTASQRLTGAGSWLSERRDPTPSRWPLRRCFYDNRSLKSS